jgi:hypothetical protein
LNCISYIIYKILPRTIVFCTQRKGSKTADKSRRTRQQSDFQGCKGLSCPLVSICSQCRRLVRFTSDNELRSFDSVVFSMMEADGVRFCVSIKNQMSAICKNTLGCKFKVLGGVSCRRTCQYFNVHILELTVPNVLFMWVVCMTNL